MVCTFNSRPDFLSTVLVAGMGPPSMVTGSVPASARPTILARGLTPSFLRPASLQMRMAEAPSQICEARPAVIKPCSLPLDCSAFNDLSLPTVACVQSVAVIGIRVRTSA